MVMDTDTRVLILQQKLSIAKMHPAERDALADDLQFANDINGDTDPIKQMLKTITIQGIRRELLAHDRQARHYSDCPIAKMITEEGGKKIMPWEKADKVLAANDGGSITGWGVTLKGPVARLAIASIAIIAVVWLMLNRQDATLRKDMRETILPSVMQVIQSQTNKGEAK